MVELRLLKTNDKAYKAMCRSFCDYMANSEDYFADDRDSFFEDKCDFNKYDCAKLRELLYIHAYDIGLVLDEISEDDKTLLVDMPSFGSWKKVKESPSVLEFLRAIDAIRVGRRYERYNR